MKLCSPLAGLALVLLAPMALLRGQAPHVEFRELPVPKAEAPLRYAVVLPPQFAAERAYPLLFAMPAGAMDEAAVAAGMQRHWGALGERGWVVVSPVCAGREHDLPLLLQHLRQTFCIAQGGMYLAGAEPAAVEAVWRLGLAQPQEFQSITAWPAAVPEREPALARLHGRRVALLVATSEREAAAATPRNLARLRQAGLKPQVVAVAGEPDAANFADHFVALFAERTLAGAAGEVSAALDAFHDAAAKGDEKKYFALLPDDAVFLGTDGTERWTGQEFRAFAMPYFERGPAWTYVPMSRHVSMAAGEALAWFDEMLDNEGYGECRGSGVLEKRGDQWVVRQYNLSIPIPNDVARGVVERIRAFAEQRVPACTTVVVVRHAEKGDGEDPDLNEIGKARSERLQRVLASLSVNAVFATDYRRTQATVRPLCESRKLTAEVLPAGKTKELAGRVRKDHLGEVVVVAGHSNTVPALLKELGVIEPVKMKDEDYDCLFVVTLGVDGARLLRLHY